MSPMMRALSLVLIASATLLAACGGPKMDVSQMTAAEPVDLQTAHVAAAPQAEYQIGVGDKLSVRVFQVPDLSFDELTVDTAGNVQMPLIGAVRAAGLTSGQLSAEIAERATFALSFSPWTLPHELARLVLAEQLYRAGTILRGEPYHK